MVSTNTDGSTHQRAVLTNLSRSPHVDLIKNTVMHDVFQEKPTRAPFP